MVKLKVRVYFSRSIHGWIQQSYEYDTYICMSINMHSVCVCVYIFLASWVRVWFGLSGPLQWRIKEIKARYKIKLREGERFHLFPFENKNECFLLKDCSVFHLLKANNNFFTNSSFMHIDPITELSPKIISLGDLYHIWNWECISIL